MTAATTRDPEREYFDYKQWISDKNKLGKEDAVKAKRVEIWKGTERAIKERRYVASSGGVNIATHLAYSNGYADSSEKKAQTSYRYDSEPDTDGMGIYFGPVSISVLSQDSIDQALRRRGSPGNEPVILNMANAYVPGGGYKNGAGAQEESLFRRSNYSQLLTPDMYGSDGIPPNGGIYTPNVLVFRESESKGYRFMDQPVFAHFIAAAAVDLSREDLSGLDKVRFKKDMRPRIRAVLRIAENHGHETIILGAWGSGAFRNPPDLVAQLFKEELQNLTANGRKTTILRAIFAILGGEKSKNLVTYKQVLGITA